MTYSPQIQRLVDKAERAEKTSRARRSTAAVVVGSRRWTDAKRSRDSRSAAKTRLGLLRYKLRKAREQSKVDMAAMRVRGKASRPALQKAVAAFRAKWRAWVNARVAEFRAKHRKVWRGRVDAAKLAVARAQFELKAERGYQRDTRRQAAVARKAKLLVPKAQRTGRLHAAESDHYVEANLPADLVPVWRVMRRRIKTAGTHRTREEAFLEWCHDHSDAVDRIRADQAEAAYPDIAREMAEGERRYYERRAG